MAAGVRFLTSFVVMLTGAALTAGRRPAASTTINGVVFDSLAMRGLRGATVQLAEVNGNARPASKMSDTLGRFEFTEVAAGTYLLGFFHPTLDSLGLESQVLRVDVRTDTLVRVRLAVPSAATIARTICGAKPANGSGGLLLGFLRNADNSMPRSDGRLSVRWSEIVIDRGAIRREIPTAEATAGASGQFAICGLPLGTPILLQGSSASDSSGLFEVTVPSAGMLHRDVYVAQQTRTLLTVADSAPPVAVLRGKGRIRGRVAGSGGRPVPNARVMIWGTGLATTTNDSGYFSLGALPNGTHMLEARALGFAPSQVAVDILPGAYDDATVELPTLGVTLAKVNVTAEEVYASPERAALQRRMKMGLGRFYDEKEIARRHAQVLTDLFHMVPGLQVVPGPVSGENVFMRGSWGPCRPQVIVDGIRIAVDDMFPVNTVAPMDQVRAVEVYTTIVPAEFMTSNGCGVIVVWTGRGSVGKR